MVNIEMIEADMGNLQAFLAAFNPSAEIVLWYLDIPFFIGNVEELKRSLSMDGKSLFISDVEIKDNRINARLRFPTNSELPYIIECIVNAKNKALT